MKVQRNDYKTTTTSSPSTSKRSQIKSIERGMQPQKGKANKKNWSSSVVKVFLEKEEAIVHNNNSAAAKRLSKQVGQSTLIMTTTKNNNKDSGRLLRKIPTAAPVTI